MRICSIKKGRHNINDEVGFKYLSGNKKTGEVDTIDYCKQFPTGPGGKLKPNEYIYIYIPPYEPGNEKYYGESIPVYGIHKNNKIKWKRIDFPRTKEEIDNFLKNSLHDSQPGQMNYWNNEEDERKRINCEKLKEFLNNDKIGNSKNRNAELKKEIIAELKKEIEKILQTEKD